MTKQRTKAGSNGAALSPRRKRLFTAVTLLVPLLFLCALEGGLRLFRYGPDTSLFASETIAGREWHVMNPDVKYRYFPTVDFSPNTSPDYFLLPKPPGTFRIFCLGGSTTAGFPYGFAGSFSSYLRDRLKATFPGRRFEVINLGITATNSFTAADIMRELPPCSPDLVIVYDGHNEFYGALGAASRESFGGSLLLSRLALRLTEWKTYLLCRNLIRSAAGFFDSAPPSGTSGGTMMERLARGRTVAAGSTVYRETLRNFAANIDDLLAVARAHGIPVILSSQVSNLRDCPPLDDGSPAAHAHYERARALDRAGNYRTAEAEYVAARDADELRFRAPSDLNKVIARSCDGTQALFVDIEKTFREQSPDSLIGSNLILEHLHPNERGYFLIGKAYAEAMRAHGLGASPQEWAAADTVADQTLWRGRPLTTVDSLAALRRTDLLTSGWPFVHTPGIHPPPAGPAIGAGIDPAIRGVVNDLVGAKITWEVAHVRAAAYEESHGMPELAAADYRALINQFPWNVSAYLFLGRLYIRTQRPDTAAALLRSSLEVETTPYALKTLGTLALDVGHPADAIPWLMRGAALDGLELQEKCDLHFLLGVGYFRTGEKEKARAELQRVLDMDPSYRRAKEMLGTIERQRE